jgi:hypothetical protein
MPVPRDTQREEESKAMNRAIPALLALLAGIALAILAATPPAPRSAQSPADVFAAGRAMADVRVIAAKPHPGTSPEDAAVRAYLVGRLRAMGLEAHESPLAGGAEAMATFARWSGQAPAPLALHNVIGVLPGKDRTLPAVALMAHHDTVWGSPGAADDTTGVASLLEVVRAVKAGGTPQRDLIVLITDGEELGLDGARQFFTADPLHRRIGSMWRRAAGAGGRPYSRHRRTMARRLRWRRARCAARQAHRWRCSSTRCCPTIPTSRWRWRYPTQPITMPSSGGRGSIIRPKRHRTPSIRDRSKIWAGRYST